ncbi:MAG: maleylpyruvate isomerase N-terminal domain-containing protein [Ferruginibacter sp.]|nr:maleylpyruvate isomerase N-terminal domain-containing protein [Cytophagales bacterium]
MKNVEFLQPIFTAHLFANVESLLIELLRSLDSDEWEQQTVAPQWKVKDVAAHLLDTQLRKLSLVRDGYAPETPSFAPDADFVSFINRLNHEGVSIYRRLSPEVLISLLEFASRESDEYHRSLDPLAKAQFAVSWAGEEESLNWFDTAREFTERWHHQQQIRLATDKPGIMTRALYFPVLDAFMRALPFHYRNTEAKPNSLAQFTVSGACGGSWYLYRDAIGWKLIAQAVGDKIAEVTLPQEIAWRIFTKGIDKQSALAQVNVSGDEKIGLHVVNMLSIVG